MLAIVVILFVAFLPSLAYAQAPLTPVLGVAPSSIDFGCLPNGSSRDTTALIVNVAPDPLSQMVVSAIQVQGLGFSLVACPPLPITIAGGSSVPVLISFNASDGGESAATLTVIAAGAINSPFMAELSGNTCLPPDSPPESNVFDSGLFVAYGHVLDPPYELRLHRDSLTINQQFRLVPPVPRAVAPSDSVPRDPEVVEYGDTVFNIIDSTYRECKGLMLQGASHDEAMKHARERLGSPSPYIDHIEQINANTIVMYMNNPSIPDLIPLHFTLNRLSPRPAPLNRARSRFEELSVYLRNNTLVIYTQGGDFMTMPGSSRDEVLECIRAIQEEGHGPPDCEQRLGTFANDLRQPLRTVPMDGGK